MRPNGRWQRSADPGRNLREPLNRHRFPNSESNVDRSLLVLAEGELYRPRNLLPQYMLWIAAVGAVVLAIVGFHLWYLNRRPRDRRAEEATPEDILAELCRVHELTRLEQTLVVKIARDQHLP